MKTIVIACGTGAVSSVLMNAALEELLHRSGTRARLIRCRLGQLCRYEAEADLVVTSVRLSQDIAVPVVMGTPFLTGRGVTELEETVLKLLTQ